MTRKTRPYREALLEALADPIEAAYYLNVALEDSPEMFRKACLNVIQAHQVATVARSAGISREGVYRTFSEEGNPTFETLRSVLDVLQIKMEFRPKEPATTSWFPLQVQGQIRELNMTTDAIPDVVIIGAGNTIVVEAKQGINPAFTSLQLGQYAFARQFYFDYKKQPHKENYVFTQRAAERAESYA
ncbi:MAG: addiction module antidote protein [Terriglobales bacterium]